MSMNKQEIKKVLKNYSSIDRIIETKNRQLCRLISLRERLCSGSNNFCNSINWDKELEKFVLEDIKVLILSIDNLISQREFIENMVNFLNEFDRRLITLRYFLNKSVISISLIINYSESTVYRKLKIIIEQLGMRNYCD